MSDAMNHPLPPEIGEPPIDVTTLLAQETPPTTATPTSTPPDSGN